MNIKRYLPCFIKDFLIPFQNRRIYAHVNNSPISNRFTHEIEAFIAPKLKLNNNVFFDIGANEGLYSILMEQSFNGYEIYTFEPLNSLHRKLKKKIKHGHHFECALSNKCGHQEIKVPEINGQLFETRATLEKNLNEENQSSFKTSSINTITLDEFILQSNVNIGLIKIDVEGHEEKVIDGGRLTLKNQRPIIIIEIEQRHHQKPIEFIFKKILDIGYDGWWIDKSNAELKSINDFNSQDHQNPQELSRRNFKNYSNNFIFLNKNDFENQNIIKTLLRNTRT